MPSKVLAAPGQTDSAWTDAPLPGRHPWTSCPGTHRGSSRALWPVPVMQGQRKAGGWALSTSHHLIRLQTVATSLRLSPGDLPVSALG